MAKEIKKKSFGFIILFLFIIITVGALYAYYYMPNFKQVPLHKYFSEMDLDRVSIVLNDKAVELSNNPIIQDNEIYLPVDFIKDYIDKYIFWDSEESVVSITTLTKVIRINAGDNKYLVNNKAKKLETPFYEMDKIAYLPVSFLSDFYNIEVSHNQEYNLAIIDFKKDEKTLGDIVGKANLRYEATNKSVISEKLEDTQVILFEETEGFTKVRTEKGLLGYVETKKITNVHKVEGIEVKEEIMPPLKNPITEKINLLWDMMENRDANRNDSKKEKHIGVNVISPTWFKFDKEKLNGDIVDIGDKSYITASRRNGYKVWPLLSDDTNKIANAVLTSTSNRNNAINQILELCKKYNLDGINVDFEQVTPDIAEHYLQFLRELNPLLKEQGLVLSVDMYVPTYTKYYNRTEVAKVVDYICVMTYDEYTGVSETAGPVASYSFVEKGITDTLEEVPREKIIMGIPFYSRVWKDDKIYGAYGVNRATKMFKDKGAEFIWDEGLKLYYSEFKETEDGKESTYKVWLEDERALEEKMQIYQKYELAGVASWVRSLAGEDIFEAINKHL